jgi:hypothetical protein
MHSTRKRAGAVLGVVQPARGCRAVLTLSGGMNRRLKLLHPQGVRLTRCASLETERTKRTSGMGITNAYRLARVGGRGHIRAEALRASRLYRG